MYLPTTTVPIGPKFSPDNEYVWPPTVFIRESPRIEFIKTASGIHNWEISLGGTSGSGALLSQDGLSLFVASYTGLSNIVAPTKIKRSK